MGAVGAVHITWLATGLHSLGHLSNSLAWALYGRNGFRRGCDWEAAVSRLAEHTADGFPLHWSTKSLDLHTYFRVVRRFCPEHPSPGCIDLMRHSSVRVCTRPQEFDSRVGDRIHRGVCGSSRLCHANEGGLGARRPHALLQGAVSLSFGQMAGNPPSFLLVFSRSDHGLRSGIFRQI